MVAVVAHADDGDLGSLDEADHLLCDAPAQFQKNKVSVCVCISLVSMELMELTALTWIPPRSSLPAMPSTSSMIRTCLLLTV